MQHKATFVAAVLAALASAYDFDYFPGQLAQLQGYQRSRFSECRDFIGTCAPTAANCATAVCRQCTSIVGNFPAVINSCCRAAEPTKCFLARSGTATGAVTTADDTMQTSDMASTATDTAMGSVTDTAMSTDASGSDTMTMTAAPTSSPSGNGSATSAPATSSSRAAAARWDLRTEVAVAGMAGVGFLAWAL